ncbi:helix-turn-helix domain-containing protein [Metabacillus sp. Hm71]|uniref:helix-turn-helix domain-containing protein n=1 Tax=Metabacillus sp. Hm71 TaxID=3450743 RepID=UPI003F443319
MKVRDSQLQVLWMARIDYLKNSGVKMHTHDFYQLQLIIDGEGIIEINGQSYPVLANHCYIFEKNIPHEFHFSKETITIDAKFSLSKDLIQLIESSNLMGACKVNNIDEFKQLFQLSSANLKNPNNLLPFQIDVGFKSALLGMLQDKITEYNSFKNQLKIPVRETDEGFPMVQYLKQNLQSKVSLEEMAAHFGFHPHYLIELFKKNLGTTPMQYLQSLRLEKAKEYLEFTSYSVSEIAELVGFTTPYFSRLCCERLGMPPTQIREQMRTVVGKDIVLEQDFIIDSQPSIY